MQIIRTGALLSMTDAQLAAYLKAYGATEGKTVTKDTSYLIQGTAPGNAKLEAAAKQKVKILTEDEFFDLVVENSRALGVEPEMVVYSESLRPMEPGESGPVRQPQKQAAEPAVPDAAPEPTRVEIVRLTQEPMQVDDQTVSKLGGLPLGGLPEGGRLHLLCQLNLAELAGCDLPKKGLLQVFCAPAPQLKSPQAQDPAAFVVRYLPDPKAPRTPGEARNVPGFFLSGNGSSPIRLKACAATETITQGEGFGGIKVGGVARGASGPVDARGDALVLQLDSQGPLTIGSDGLLQVFAPAGEAREGDFSHAWLRFD